MKHRSHEPEILDLRPLAPDEVAPTCEFLAAINWIGSARAIRNDLRRFARSWDAPITILDVASGGGDVPRALARWARAEGIPLSIVCLDRSVEVTAWARSKSARDPLITFVRGDARSIPFRPQSFDYVICSLFLHHLDDDAVVSLLRSADRLAIRGVVFCDLIRRRRAFLWAKVLTLFGNAVVRNDGPLSIRRAFTLDEISRLAALADIPWTRIRPVVGHHFLLSGEKSPVRLQSGR